MLKSVALLLVGMSLAACSVNETSQTKEYGSDLPLEDKPFKVTESAFYTPGSDFSSVVDLLSEGQATISIAKLKGLEGDSYMIYQGSSETLAKGTRFKRSEFLKVKMKKIITSNNSYELIYEAMAGAETVIGQVFSYVSSYPSSSQTYITSLCDEDLCDLNYRKGIDNTSEFVITIPATESSEAVHLPLKLK